MLILPLHVAALLLLLVLMLGLMPPAAYLQQPALSVMHCCCWSRWLMLIYVALASLPAHDFPSQQRFLPGIQNDLHHFLPIPVQQ